MLVGSIEDIAPLWFRCPLPQCAIRRPGILNFDDLRLASSGRRLARRSSVSAENHFEQNFHLACRLDRYGTGVWRKSYSRRLRNIAAVLASWLTCGSQERRSRSSSSQICKSLPDDSGRRPGRDPTAAEALETNEA
jgi:hypothetical protein